MKSIRSTGIITKKEKLASYQSTHNYYELILESVAPFPGYYDLYYVPLNKDEIIPKFLFLVAKKLNFLNDADFFRLSASLKQKYRSGLDLCMGSISLHNEERPAIRIAADQLSLIPGIIEDLKSAGYEFIKSEKIAEYMSLIRIKKFFTLEELNEGIYEHRKKKGVFYIPVAGLISWEKFEELTYSIRNNMDQKNFDAAMASIFTDEGMLEMVRIYDPTYDATSLDFIKKKYQSEIERIINL